MRNDNWEVKPPRLKVAPKIQGTPAKNYFGPSISKVPVVLEADSDEFRPAGVFPDGSAEIFANIPSGGITLPRGGQEVVDCGFSVVLPAGFRCVVTSSVPGVLIDLIDCKRFKVTAINLGGETNLKHGEPIGRIKVEPIYLFEWIVRN